MNSPIYPVEVGALIVTASGLLYTLLVAVAVIISVAARPAIRRRDARRVLTLLLRRYGSTEPRAVDRPSKCTCRQRSR